MNDNEPIIAIRHRNGKPHLVSETKNVKEPTEAQRNSRIRFGILSSLGKGSRTKEGTNKSSKLIHQYNTGPVAGQHRKAEIIPVWLEELAEWESRRRHPQKVNQEKDKIINEIMEATE